MNKQTETIVAEEFANLLISKGCNASTITLENVEKVVAENWSLISQAFKASA